MLKNAASNEDKLAKKKPQTFHSNFKAARCRRQTPHPPIPLITLQCATTACLGPKFSFCLFVFVLVLVWLIFVIVVWKRQRPGAICVCVWVCFVYVWTVSVSFFYLGNLDDLKWQLAECVWTLNCNLDGLFWRIRLLTVFGMFKFVPKYVPSLYIWRYIRQHCRLTICEYWSSIRTKDPNDHSDTQMGTLSTVYRCAW